MKRLLFILFASLFGVSNTFAQNTFQSMYEIKRVIDLINFNKTEQGEFRRTLSEENIVGSPYLNDEFIEGSVFTKSKTQYAEVPLRYNIFNDEIEFRTDDGQVLALASAEVIEKVEFGDFYMEYIPYMVVKRMRRGFFNVLEKGNATLYQRSHVVFEDAKQPAAYQDAQPAKFVKKPDEFYIRVGLEPALPIAKNRDLEGAFPDHKKEIAEFIKKNRVRTNNPESLKELVIFYNSLK
jgi:hypothetical protein